MDTLTHIVVGAAVGELILGKRVGKKAMLWGALAGNAPDVDALMNFFVSEVDSLVLHRGITHSIFVSALVGPLLGWFLSRYHGRSNLLGWILLFTVNLWVHEFLDTCTMYGTGLLMPLSDERFAFNNIFVVDPIYTTPLIVSVAWVLLVKSDHSHRFKLNLAGLAISSFYMVLTFINHGEAACALDKTLEKRNINFSNTNTAPTLFNSFLWNVTAQTDSGYWTGYYSVFDDAETVELYFLPKIAESEEKFDNDETVNKLRRFSKGFGIIRETPSGSYFHDLRFGQVQGWSDPNSPFGFSFNLSDGADNSMVVQQGRILGLKQPVFSSMIDRIVNDPVSR
ncbi:MAG: metal-dependent hydrolase [Bacteroidota bacterium]